MSSYLNFYIPKGNIEEEKPLLLTSFSRSNELYSIFYDNLNIAFIGNEENKYTKLEYSDLEHILDVMDTSINSVSKRITELEKYANGNYDIISEILSLKDYLEELKENRDYVRFIAFIVADTTLYCNID
jgi:hypothetical protein